MSPALAGGVFITEPTQGLNSCLLHWQAGSLSLNHQGSPLLMYEVKWSESRSVMYDSFRLHSPGQNIGVGICSLLQGIFPTQGSNPGLPHYRQILYQLRHQGSPRILEWVGYPFSSRSPRSKNSARVSFIAGALFISQASKGSPFLSTLVTNAVFHSNFMCPDSIYLPLLFKGDPFLELPILYIRIQYKLCIT